MTERGEGRGRGRGLAVEKDFETKGEEEEEYEYEEGRETDCSEIVGTDIGALADNFQSPSLSPFLSSILS